MKTALKFITVNTFATLLMACDTGDLNGVNNPHEAGSALTRNEIHVTASQVSKVNVGSINFYSVSVLLSEHEAPQNYFSVIVDRADVKEGYSTKDLFDIKQKKTIDANWNGRFYSESERFPTYVHFVIKSLSKEEAVIEVSARLVHPQTGDFIVLSPTTLNIKGDALVRLTEQI